MTHAPERTPAAYRRDLLLARQVIAQLRDAAMETRTPFHVGNLALDAAALDTLWDGLDRVDIHFWEEGSFPPLHEVQDGSPAVREAATLVAVLGSRIDIQDARGGPRPGRSPGFMLMMPPHSPHGLQARKWAKTGHSSRREAGASRMTL